MHLSINNLIIFKKNHKYCPISYIEIIKNMSIEKPKQESYPQKVF